MATEAEIPEPPISITKIEVENEYLTSKHSDTTLNEFFHGELKKFQGGNKQPPETAEFLAQTEDMQVASDFGVEPIKKVTTSNVGTSEGESFFLSPSAAELAHEETCKISKHCQADEIPFQADKKISEDEKQMQNVGKFDIAEETGSGENEIMEGTDERAEKSGMSHDILNLTGTSIQVATIEEPHLNIGEEKSLEEEIILDQHVEVIANEHASVEENLKSIEKELNNSQKNEKETTETETGETTDFESGKEILNILEATSGQNKEASIHGPDLPVDSMKKDGETVTEACKKEEGVIDTKLIGEEMEETRVKEEDVKASEKSPHLEGKETGPEAIKPDETAGIEEDMKEKILYDSIKDVPTSTVAASSNIQNNADTTIDIGEGAKEEFYKPSVTLETDMSSMIEAEPEEASNIACKEKSQDAIESNEKMKSKPPVEDEMHDMRKLETSLLTETENLGLQAVDNPEIFKQGSEIRSEDNVKETPEEGKDQTEILEKIAHTDNTASEKGEDYENPEEKVVSSFTKDEGMQSVGEGLDTTDASAMENTNEGGSTVQVGNDNISDKEIIATLENLQRKMLKHEGRPEESLLQQNEPDNENLERSLSMVFEDIHTASPSAYAETITCVSEETPIKSHEEGFEEKGEKDTPIQNDAAGDNGIPTEKNLPPTEFNEKIGSVEAEITNKNPNDLHVTHPLVEEAEQKECEELNKVSKFEPEEVNEATGSSKGEEKHVEDNPGACQSTNSAILEHISKEEAVTTELISKTCEVDTEKFQEICELDSEENLKRKEAGEKIEEAIEKDEACDAETSQITTKSDDTVKTISDTETSVMVKSNVLAGDEKIEQNSEVESTLEAAQAVSCEDESNKAEDNEDRSNIITDEVQDEPKITDSGEATNEEIIQGNITSLSPELIEKETFQSSQDNENKAEKSKGEDSGEQIIEESNVKDLSPEFIEEGPVKILHDDEKDEPKITDSGEAANEEIIQGNITCLSPELIEKETFQSSLDNENKAEKSKGEDSGEQIIEESNVKDLSPEFIEEGPVKILQDDEKEGKKSEGEIFEESETADAGKSAYETSQTVESPKDMLDTSMVIQEESRNLAPVQASPEEKRNEDRSSVVVGEENSTDTKLVKGERNLEEGEDDSKQILQDSQLKQEEGLQSEDKNLTPPEASPEEKINEDMPSVMMTEEIGRDAELVENAGNVEKCEEDSKQLLQKYEAGEMLDTSLVKQEEIFQKEGQNLNLTEASPEEKRNEGPVIGAEANGSDTEPVEAKGNVDKDEEDYEETEAVTLNADKIEEGAVQKFDTTDASATENTNEGGSTVEVGNDNISDTEIIAAAENLKREMSKHEGRPEESLLQQNESKNENLERSLSMGFEDIHTAASSASAETVTCVSEETPIKSHEEGFEEKGKEDASIQNDAAGESGIPKGKNLPPTELNENIGSVEAEITNKNPDDSHVTQPLVEEAEQKECAKLNEVSRFEPEEVHEANGKASKGEEKNIVDNPEACQSTNSAILEHTSPVTTELTSKTSEMDTEKFQEICELDSVENLKSKEAGEKIEEEIQKDETCDAETSQITTKSDDTVKTISDAETSVMVKSNVLAGEETIEQNSEVESTLEAAPAVSCEDESNKVEDNEERSSITTDQVQDGPKITDTGEATNEQMIQDNVTCLSPELIEKETVQSSQDYENKEEKSKGEDNGEQIIEESNVKDLLPEVIEEDPVKNFQGDEKETKKSEGEIFEGCETAEAGKSIAHETSQTVESDKDMLDTSMVIQEESRNLAPAEASPEEKRNEDRSCVVVGEENSTDTKLVEVKRNFEEGEDDSKQILQKKETGEMFDTSLLKQEEDLRSEDKNLTPPEASPEEKINEDRPSAMITEETGEMFDTSLLKQGGLQSEDKNLTPPEASPEEKRNEDRPSVMITEEIGRDAELVENAGNVEKCEEDSKHIFQKNEAGEMLDSSLVKQEESLQTESKNLSLTEASPEEKRNEDLVIGAEENGSETEPVEAKGNVEKDEEDSEETEAVALNSDKMEEGAVQKLDETLDKEEKDKETKDNSGTKNNLNAKDIELVVETLDASESTGSTVLEPKSTMGTMESEISKNGYKLDSTEYLEGTDAMKSIEEEINTETKEEYEGSEIPSKVEETETHIITKEYSVSDITPEIIGEETIKSSEGDESEKQMPKVEEYEGSEIVSKVEETETHIIREEYGASDITPEIIGEETIKRSEGDESAKQMPKVEEYKGSEIVSKIEDTETHIIKEEYGASDITPEIIGEETIKSSDGDENEKQMPKVEVYEELQTTSVGEDAEKQILEEKNTNYDQSTVLDAVEKTEQGSKEDNKVTKMPKEEECERIQTEDIKQNIEEGNTAEDRENLNDKPEEEVCKEFETAALSTSTETQNTEEHNTPGLPLGEETVKESSKEDESDAMQLKEEVHDSNSALIEKTEATGSAEETTYDTLKEPKNHHDDLHIIKAREEDGDLVDNYLVSGVSEKDIKEEISAKGETTINDSDSVAVMVETEGTSYKEAEAEDKMQVESSDLDSQETDLAATETKGTMLVSVDSGAKPENSSNLGENRNETIPTETDEAGEKMEYERQDKVPDAGNEGQKEETTSDTCSKDILGDDLKENPTMPPKEHQLMTTKASETTEDTPEKIQAPYENLEAPFIAQTTDENMIQKEDKPTDSIDDSELRSVDTGKENEDEEVQKHGGEDLYVHPVLDTEQYISKSEDVENLKREETGEVADQRGISESKSVKDEESSSLQLEKETYEDEKPLDEASKCIETLGTCTDGEKNILEEENFAKSVVDSSKEGVEVENAAVEFEGGAHSHGHEVTNSKDDGTPTEENLESADPDERLKFASELVAEDQSIETLSESNNSQIEGNSNDIQNQEREKEIKEEKEPKLEPEDRYDTEQNTDETIKAVILSEEVNEGVEKADNDEIVKEQVIEVESGVNELHTVITKDETINEVKDSSPQFAEYVKATDSNIEATVKKESEEEKAKEGGSEKPVDVSITPAEESEEKIENIIEETQNYYNKNDTAIGTAVTAERSLREAQLDDKLVKSLKISSDETSLKKTETVATEETSCDLASQIPANDRDHAEKESGILENPNVVEDEETKISCGAVYESKDQETKETDETGKGPTVEKLDAGETEEASNLVPDYKSQGVEAVIEDEITADLTLPAEKPEEQLQTPSPFEEQKHLTTTTVDREEEDKTKEAEKLEDESPEDSSAAKTTKETCLQMEEPRELEVPKLGLELNDEDIKHSSNEVHEEERETMDEVKEDTATVCETVSKSESQEIEAVTEDEITADQTVLVETKEVEMLQDETPENSFAPKTTEKTCPQMEESRELELSQLGLEFNKDMQKECPNEVQKEEGGTLDEVKEEIKEASETTADQTLPLEISEEQHQTPSSALLCKEQEHGTTRTIENIEEKTKEVEMLQDDGPENSSATKTTEETCLQMVESRELEISQSGLELNKDMQKDSPNQVHEEERGTLDEVKEDMGKVSETVSKSESQGIEPVLVETPSTTLLLKEQEHGTVTTMEKTEEKTKEVEMLQDDIPENSSAPKTTEETCPRTEEPSELELSQLGLDLDKDMQKECPNEVQKEEGGTLEEIKEASETVWQSKSEGVEAAKITADPTLPLEISEEQHQTPSSALLCKEQEHETTRTIENIEEKTREVEMLQDESPENSFATKTTEETCLQMGESRELEVSQLGLELNQDMQKDSPNEVHEEEKGTLDEGKEDTGKASETGSKSESQGIEAVTENEISVDQTVLVETPSTTSLLKEQEHETVTTMEKTEEKTKEVEMLQDDIPENSSAPKTTEETCAQTEEPSELELSQLGLDLDKDMQKECTNEVQMEEGGTLDKSKEASETTWQSKSEGVGAAKITADQTLPLEISEEQHQTPSSILLCKEQEHETIRTIENIEEKTKEMEMLQDESPENSSATKTTEETCLQMVESRELEVSQLGLELKEDMQKDSPNEVTEKEKGTLDEVKEEIREASETVSKSRDHGSEAAIEDGIIAHQRLPEEKLEEQHQTPSTALLSREQKHGTTAMIENVEENMKEMEMPEHGNLENSSATKTTEETCLQKVEPRELEVTEDIQKDSPNETNVEECKILDKDVKVEPQEYEVEMKSESPSESEKITELTRPFEEASSAKSEISEEAFEFVSDIHGQDILTKLEDTKKHPEEAITDLKAEDNQYEKIIDATEIVQNEVLIEQIKEEKEDAKNCQPVSPGEETFKESHQEIELKAEENLGANTNETFQKEELYEEITKAGASKNIVKQISAEEKIVENETIKEELGKDVKEASSIVDLQNQCEETNFGDDTTKATILREEELGEEISQNEGTMDPAEAFEVTRDLQQQEKTSHAASEKQLSGEAEPNPSIEVMSAGKKDVPIIETLQNSKVGDSEPGYATGVDSGVKGYEHGGEKRKDDSGEITIEEFTSMDSDKLSLSDLMQRSKKETPQVAGHLTEEKEPMARKEEMHVKDMRTVIEKDEEEEGDQHEKTDSGSDAPVMVEACRDMDVKVAHKKSHNILSGVGSKVKHSISKVKKAFTGKSSHSKAVSPK